MSEHHKMPEYVITDFFFPFFVLIRIIRGF